jgi:aminopeptidase N
MRRVLAVWWVLLALAVSPVLAQRPARQPPGLGTPASIPPGESPQSATAKEPLRTATDRLVDIRHIRLEMRVDLEKKAVDSKATVSFRSIRPTRSVSLDAVGFEVKQVALADEQKSPLPVPHLHDGKKLVVDLGATWPAGHTGTLVIDYHIQNPKDGLHFFAPSKTQPDAPLMVWSQGETISNRYWIPCLDEPDQRQTTEVVVTVPAGFQAVSNGKLVEEKENSDKTVTFDWRQDIPHPAYLVTLAVREFDVVREEWDGIPVLFYVPKGRRAEALPTYGKTREMLTFFSQRFGIHYPWAKYAQVNGYQYGGGMENTSATTMGDRILIDERTLLDRNSESIVSHELAHQWWGDMVTCRDWSHTWLNEGFASYAEALWEEHTGGTDAYAYEMHQKATPAIRGGKTRPIMDLHYPSPDTMFDGRAYPKGAWVLHMLRNRLGDEAFFKGIQQYGTEHKFQSVETFDFRRSMEKATGRDIERFFYDWLERPGNPDMEVTTDYVPDAQQARIVVKQTQSGEPFHIPVKLVLFSSGTSEPIVLQEEMTEKELKIQTPLKGMLTRIDVDPEQAILTELKETKARDLWRAQLLEGPNVPARLRAVHHFAESKDDEDRALLAQAFAGEKFWAIKVELARALGNAGGTVARDALLQGLHQADARIRRACVSALGNFNKDASVVTVVKEILQKGDPSYGVESAALEAYGRSGQKDAAAMITPWLSKPSFEDTLSAAALTALGATRDPGVLDTLLEWAQPGHPANARGAAQRALVPFARNKNLTDAQRKQIVKNVVDALEGGDGFARFRLLNTLPELGPLAEAALPALDKMAQDTNYGRMRDAVKRVADEIRAKTKPSSAASAPPDLKELQEQIKRLQREQDELRKRLDKYEKPAPGKRPLGQSREAAGTAKDTVILEGLRKVVQA